MEKMCFIVVIEDVNDEEPDVSVTCESKCMDLIHQRNEHLKCTLMFTPVVVVEQV